MLSIKSSSLEFVLGRQNRVYPKAISSDERRGDVRIVTMLRVGVLHSDSRKDLCVVRNLSAGGLAARVYRSFSIGESLRVELREGDCIEGSVRWAREREIGVAFSESIDVEAVLSTGGSARMACASGFPGSKWTAVAGCALARASTAQQCGTSHRAGRS